METNQAPQPGAGKPRFDLRQMLAALRRNRRLAIVIAVFVLAVLVVGFLALAGGNPLVQLRRLSVALMNRIQSNYRFVIGFNGGLIALGALGILAPATSATLHNLSTLGISLRSMTNLLPPAKA